MNKDVALSPRELEVLVLVARGFVSQRIARRLGIGIKSVCTHVEHIRKKLGVHTRAQAISVALKRNLLPSTPTTTATTSEPKLTLREKEVLTLAGHGLTARRTAEHLGISLFTVRCHREHIRAKLGVFTIAQAIAKMQTPLFTD